MSAQLLFVHALSPLHAGTGQSEGAIELAVARDRATQFPYLPGSSIKGSLRDLSRAKDASRTLQVFGPETSNASDYAGTLSFGDAGLLLLPVRSVAGTFAWVTSPYLLARLGRDLIGLGQPGLPAIIAPGGLKECRVSSDTWLTVPSLGKAVLEELDITPISDPSVATLAAQLGGYLFNAYAQTDQDYWRDCLRRRLCVVHDDVMSFLSQHATDVVARVALEADRKTVRRGGLWHEENLPTETILAGLVVDLPNERAGLKAGESLRHLRSLTELPIQLGGKATVGRGRCRLVLGDGR